MKITKLETFHVKPRWLFLKIHTDGGICGWGEPILEGRTLTVETAVHEIGRTLVGENPFEIERLWQRYYRGTFYRGGPILTSALSGIEQALWDILGKALDVPVHQLLGGRVRDRIRMYGWTKSREVGDYVDEVARRIEDGGISAFKFVPMEGMQMVETPAVLDRVVDEVQRIRDVIGWEVDLAVDFHGRTSPAVAKQLARLLEPLRPMFIEEPVLPGNTEALKEIKESTTIPVAAGERLFTRWQFKDVIHNRAVSIVQPDLSHAGGIMEVRKIAAMAEAEDIALAPHCPLGPIALASSLQVDACSPNFLCQEHVTLGEDYLVEAFVIKDGYIAVTDKPGLGIEIDERKVEAGRYAGDWETPQFRLKDGSFAEW